MHPQCRVAFTLGIARDVAESAPWEWDAAHGSLQCAPPSLMRALPASPFPAVPACTRGVLSLNCNSDTPRASGAMP